MARTPLLPRSAYPVWTRIQTRWADNDAYGHVNNTVHYQWFDTAVNGWLIEAGLLDLGGSGDPIGLVVETGCRYAGALSYPQAIDVGLGVETLGQSSVRYRLGIFAEGEPHAAAEGHFVHVHVGRGDHRPVPIPDAWRTAYEAIRLTA